MPIGIGQSDHVPIYRHLTMDQQRTPSQNESKNTQEDPTHERPMVVFDEPASDLLTSHDVKALMAGKRSPISR